MTSHASALILRQLFDAQSSTYTYLLADANTRDAVLIDPVWSMHDRDMEQLTGLALRLRYTLETHVHADHVTGAARLKHATQSLTVVSKAAGVGCADVAVVDGDVVTVGALRVLVRATPGHTASCVTYVVLDHNIAFTGDALLVRGCGRTDFQQGSPAALYRSVREVIFALHELTQLYPGHDYKGRTVTTPREERLHNPRLKDGTSVQAFTALMAGLKLAHPKLIDVAVPANLRCGADHVPGQRTDARGPGEDGDGI